MGKLTLADLERIAARFSKAVADIREGQAMLGGSRTTAAVDAGPMTAMQDAPDSIAAHRARQFQAPELPPSNGKLKLSPQEQADRARVLAQFRDDPGLPDEIRQMENAE